MSAEVARGNVGSTTRLHLTRRGRVVFTTLAAFPLVVGAVAFALNGGVAIASAGSHARAASSLGTASHGAASHGTASLDTADFDRASFDTVAFEYVTVQAGQSLWQLAETIAPTADPRDVIADIVSLNGLPADAVEPGQRLAIPAEY